MAANLETMFYVSNEENERFVPWHGMGTPVMVAPNSEEALKVAGLDWDVIQTDVFTDSGIQIPNYKANVRSTDNKILGVVSDRYQIVQNKEAFDFTDNLIDSGDVRYETAGCLQNGRVWLLARLPEHKVLDDAFEPYLMFTNSHNGRTALTCCITDVRVVCQNTMALALNKAKNTWTTRHKGDMNSKLAEARYALGMANDYLGKFGEEAERLFKIKVGSDINLNKFLAELFPTTEDDTDRKKENMKACKEKFMACYFAPDLANYMGTAYALLQASSDFATHVKPLRNSNNYAENNFEKVLNGEHPLIATTYNIINSMATV